jgi:hypothetical protein
MRKKVKQKTTLKINPLRPIVTILLLITLAFFFYLSIFNVLSGVLDKKTTMLSLPDTGDNVVVEDPIIYTTSTPNPTLETLQITTTDPTLNPTTKPTTKPILNSTTTPAVQKSPTPIVVLPTYTPIPLKPGQVGPNCPVSTQNCVPCLAGEAYCRTEAGKPTGFKGWACQNNNPGNIRPASFKNTMISNNGGIPPCGERSGYMVFSDYATGLNALRAYFKGINRGEHSAYKDVSAGIYCGECNLNFIFFRYSPLYKNGVPVTYAEYVAEPNTYAKNVASWIGVDVETTMLSWIVNNKLDQLVNAVQRQEGWFVN